MWSKTSKVPWYTEPELKSRRGGKGKLEDPGNGCFNPNGLKLKCDSNCYMLKKNHLRLVAL